MKLVRKIILLFVLANCLATADGQKTSLKCNVIFIGNSITHGATLPSPALHCPPAHAIKLLREKGYSINNYANCGFSGSTTVDFLPSSKNLFLKVVRAADTLYDAGAWLVFSITLGTNDSAIEGPNGAPVAADDYGKNIRTIIDSLHNRYPHSVFVLHRPIWYSTNTYNRSKYLAEGLERLQTYTPQLDKLVKENAAFIFKGDRKAYSFFEHEPEKYFTHENGNAGIFFLHPNTLGAEKLGEFWANSLANTIAVLYRNSAHTQVGRPAY